MRTDESPSAIDETGQTIEAGEVASPLPVSSPVHDDGHMPLADMVGSEAPSSESGEMGQRASARKVVAASPISPLLSQLAELQVRRKFYINLVNKQTNAAKALVRRAMGWKYDDGEEDRAKMNKRAAGVVSAALAGKEPKADDAAVFGALSFDLAVISAAVEPCQKARDGVEKEMKRLAKQLPVHPWAKDVHGFGDLGLAVIVGEAGDIGSYPKKGHLWKRLGLAPHDGKAYSTWRRDGGLTADDWVAAGYSPRRRAEVFAVISEPLFRQQSVAKGPYRAIYDRRKAATTEAHADWTPMHRHMDALRVMTKYLIRDLRVAWRRVVDLVPEGADRSMPAASQKIGARPKSILPLQPAAHRGTPSSDPIEREAERKSAIASGGQTPTARPHTKRRKANVGAPEVAEVAMPT